MVFDRLDAAERLPENRQDPVKSRAIKAARQLLKAAEVTDPGPLVLVTNNDRKEVVDLAPAQERANNLLQQYAELYPDLSEVSLSDFLSNPG